MSGAVTPDYFLTNPEWLDFALMAEAVEGEISNPPKGANGQDTISFEIVNPDEDDDSFSSLSQ
jgi:hypothetical protein